MTKVVLAMDPEVHASLRLDRLATVADVDLGRVVSDFATADPALLRDAELLFTCWGCPPLTAEALALMPALRGVVHAAGTVRHHVTAACWDRGLAVSTATAANAVPVAEYTLAAILFSGKRVLQIADSYRRSRTRSVWDRMFPTFGNYRTTVGIVGASTIGRLVLERLRSFDVDVLLYDPYVSPQAAAALGAVRVGLDELAARSDVVSIHAPEIPETYRMVDARLLGLMRDGTTLINTARGSLVDADALVAELSAGRLHAVIDVTDPDVLPADSALFDVPNLLLTPHIAGSLGNELTRMTDSAIDEVARYAAGLGFAHPVRPEALVRSA